MHHQAVTNQPETRAVFVVSRSTSLNFKVKAAVELQLQSDAIT